MKLSRKFFCQVKFHLPLNPFENVSRLGIDEIAHRKGRNSYHLILYDLDSGHPLDVLENRTQKQLCQYLQGLPQALKDSIKEVCIDMWRPYALAIKEQLPDARLMIDRFHVMKSVTTELKYLKNKEKKQLPKEAQGCHYAILKNQDRLTPKQQEILDQVYQHSRQLKRAHQFKEQFRAIFEENLNTYQARKKLQKWISKAYKHQFFPKSIISLKNWLTPILNYFQNRTTNGVAEGVNNKIKLVLRRAFGFRNYHNMRLRILAAFH